MKIDCPIQGPVNRIVKKREAAACIYLELIFILD